MTSDSAIDEPAVAAFDDVADELYVCPPHGFAALRARRAEQARITGEADLATRIEKLRVPSVAAWLSNQLVRYFRDQVLLLLDLGRALQVATDTLNTDTLNTDTLNTDTLNTDTLNTDTLNTDTLNTDTSCADRPDEAWLDSDAVRRLNQRRRDAYGELDRLASWLALEGRVTAGRPALRGLGDTLHSAMCSERMAQEMLTGRLVRSLPRISWPGLTAESFPDELARRRALRVARGIEHRPSRFTTEADEKAENNDEDDGPLATVTDLLARTR